MPAAQQEVLRRAWTEGRKGYLSAWSEAKLRALHEVWRSEKKSERGLLPVAAASVKKHGTNKSPSTVVVFNFYAKVDADSDWLPGKLYREKNGPDRVPSWPQVSGLARCAQAMKERGQEPTYRSVVAACPAASLNQQTGQVVGKKRVYDVFREHCRDPGATATWQHKARYSKKALTPGMMEKRLAFSVHVQGLGHRAVWFYNHVVWTDICNSILPRSERKASEQALARKGKKCWGSLGCEMHSSNWRFNLF